MSDADEPAEDAASSTNVVSVLPKDPISSVDEPTFGDEYFGDPGDEGLVVEPADGVVEATVGATEFVVLATGDGLHALEPPGFELRVEDGNARGDGATWTPPTGESDDGRRLRQVPTRRLYAFAC